MERIELRKLNVLHIITKFELGGAQKSTLFIAALLDKTRYNLSIVSSQDGILVCDALKIPKVDTTLLPALKRSIDPFQDLLALIKLTKFIKTKRFDIVHTHSSKAGILGRWAAKFAGVPIILHTIHGWSFHHRQNPLIRKLFVFLEQITAKITDRLIAVSKSDIKKGLDAGIGPKDKYALIRYGIPIREFSYCKVDVAKKKEKLGLKRDSPVVGMVACFKPQKAPQDFLKIAALVKNDFPEASFLLVGDGILRDKLEGLKNELGLRNDLHLIGWRRDIPEIMSILDVLVLTSLWEGLPIVLLEGMASGLPIVATATAGAQETIRNEINGFLASYGDTGTMAQRVVALLENRALARKMGQEGKKLLDSSFELERMVGQTDELYQTLAERFRLC